MTSPTDVAGAIPGRRTVLVTAAAAAGLLAPAAVPAAHAADGAPMAPPRLRVPAPTGPHRVGVRATYVVDATRPEPVTGGPRTLPVHVWYPARGGRPHRPGFAPYLSPVLRPVYEAAFGVPPGTLVIDTHADAQGGRWDAPQDRGGARTGVVRATTRTPRCAHRSLRSRRGFMKQAQDCRPRSRPRRPPSSPAAAGPSSLSSTRTTPTEPSCPAASS